MRGSPQRSTQDRLGPIIAIDISLIDGGDALLETGFQLGLHMGGRGVLIIGNTPHAIDKARDFKLAG